MGETIQKQESASRMITFYHDIEQGMDSDANPEECRQIVKEFLKLEKKYNVPVTYNVVGKLFQQQPDLIELIRQEGHEVAFHSYNHQSDWQPKYYSDEIALCKKLSSLTPGYRSPRSQWNEKTIKSLWENGFLWSAETDRNKEPYFIYKGLVRLPIALDDWGLHTDTTSIDQWIQEFSKLLEDRPYSAIGLHDCYTSLAPKERLNAWEKVLQIAIENKALLVTFSEAADLFRRASLSQYYNISAVNWNRSAKKYYRTKRFQELLKSETEKLNQPIIADLGSGGGVLSSILKGLAKKIYCVDNAPGMIAEVDSCLQACIGEVTDSNLPDDSIDLVMCARVIEYLFWPNSLADEIKRIGKIGATYFVTFPAFHEPPPSREGSTPNKIRHYYTADEVKQWASQIGHGRLIGIQYKKSEPDSPEAETYYRALEKNPPSDANPTDWIYIGTIQNKPTAKRNRKAIPASAFNFSFPSQRYYRFVMFLENVTKWIPKPIRKIGKGILYK